eukprot:2140484-Ditylum_brightwellii.AAC.1
MDNIPEDIQLAPASFRKIVKTISTKDAKIKQTIDYMSGVLMYDNFTCLRSVATTSPEADHINAILNCLEGFIKTTYKNHIGSCAVTAKDFSLSPSGEGMKQCSICYFPQHVLEYVKKKVDIAHGQLLDDAAEKLIFFFGHWFRVLGQQGCIDEVLLKLKSNEAMIVMDFKMKYKAIYYQEKTTDFYGKKWIFVAWEYDLHPIL